MCVGDETWVGPHMTCSPRRCKHPGDIPHGQREGNAFIYPNRVTYSCVKGYELVGQPYRVCEAAGEWSGNLPSCKPVTCPRLSSPANGHIHSKDFLYGSEVRFTCFDGFNLTGSRSRVCHQNGVWSGTESTCELVDCKRPGPFYDGEMFVEKTTYGAEAIFTCFDRTTLDGSTHAVCMSSGRWHPEPPKCWRQCEIPEVLYGGVFNRTTAFPGTFVNNGTRLQFVCQQGYQLKNSEIAECFNGSWSTQPVCVPAPCTNNAPPNDIRDGMVRFHGLEHNDKAKYKCKPGFELKGDTYLVCQNGEWRGTKPTCEPVYCDHPGTIKNGQILLVGAIGKYEYRPYVSRIGHNEQIEFQCVKGYKRIGPVAATCVDGKWSPDVRTYCVPGQHPKLLYVFRGKREAIEND